MNLTPEEEQIFCTVTDLDNFAVPEGAYNFRVNGKSVGRNSTDNINIVPKLNGQGLDIYVAPNTRNETIHIPVAISASGLKETVYNDFHIGEDARITIIAGCGIYNCGPAASRHDGVHRFEIARNAEVKYIEKHYGFGHGASKNLNPTTEINLAENASAYLEMEQIKGVDNTIRETKATLAKNAKLIVKERLLTHGRQAAESNYDIILSGEDAAADLASRSVARNYSKQTFKSTITATEKSHGHSECDAIITDDAKVYALPALNAETKDAELIHEAAIGKLASDQIAKLMTLGLSREKAESKIINGFLR